MEQNNIEQQFRDKLNQREIKPSEQAWDRLDAMLTVAEKPKERYGWLYIAAGFLGFILIATAFFSQTKDVVDIRRDNTLVFEQNQTVSPKGLQKKEVISPQPSSAERVATTANRTAAKINSHSLIKSINQGPVQPVIKEALPNADSSDHQIATVSNQNTIINQKTEQKEINPKPTYVDVDELLAAVEKPSKKDKQFSGKSGISVNANSLLSQVDGELELSFREKVIRSVNKNYQNVKVALANRNKE